MKSSLLRPLAFAFIASALLSSCSVLQKGEFAQRKYYNFPRTNHSVDGKQDETAHVAPVKAAPIDHAVNKEANTINETTSSVSVSTKQVVPAKIKLPALVIGNKRTQIKQEEVIQSDVPVISEKRSDVKAFSKERTFYELLSGGASFALQILAAIFLPPIGVYLHDNGRTGAWFWVTMLLCIGAIACFAIGSPAILSLAGGGLWFVAALCALLVVFDVF
jgi:uncharacterized membrane protein YqaE (UPF0057 family)